MANGQMTDARIDSADGHDSPDTARSGGQRVLLIDDEAQMRRLLRAALPPHGYALAEACTGRDGIADAGMNNPDIILLDLGLPDTDGIEVAKQLRDFTRT